MKTAEFIFVWGLFLASSVFGHVALKHAAGASERFDWGRAFLLWKEPWAMGAGISWIVSCFLWGLLLTRFEVGEASGHSALRYVLILAAAWFWLGETVSIRQGIGCALIGVGILLLSMR